MATKPTQWLRKTVSAGRAHIHSDESLSSPPRTTHDADDGSEGQRTRGTTTRNGAEVHSCKGSRTLSEGHSRWVYCSAAFAFRRSRVLNLIPMLTLVLCQLCCCCCFKRPNARTARYCCLNTLLFVELAPMLMLAFLWVGFIKLEVFINQWSAPIDVNTDSKILSDNIKLTRQNMISVICDSLLETKSRNLVDSWPFAGHHPYPPAKRESVTAAGMQFSDLGGFCCCRSVLISHTIHGHMIKYFKPRSDTAAYGIISVYLQAWNSWYHLAGYVEVNVAKDRGIEHPMWILGDVESYFHMSELMAINKLFEKLGEHFADFTKATC
eukprot:jgi/Bigna1/74472/fgenesh1_pg.29_\